MVIWNDWIFFQNDLVVFHLHYDISTCVTQVVLLVNAAVYKILWSMHFKNTKFNWIKNIKIWVVSRYFTFDNTVSTLDSVHHILILHTFDTVYLSTPALDEISTCTE